MSGGDINLESDFKKLAAAAKLAHGYIFFGPGVKNKRDFAFSLARYLEEGVFSPSGKVLGDTIFIAPPKRQALGIEQIREVKNFLWQRPNRSLYRTLILDGSVAITAEAQNALLKVAEEPPPSALIILLIDDPERLQPTLQSRFQKIFFPQPAGREVVEKYLSVAGEFWNSPASKRETLIRELLADTDFDLDCFLEALLFVLPRKKDVFGVWHAVLELRRQIDYFNLNPRLQLLFLSRLMDSRRSVTGGRELWKKS